MRALAWTVWDARRRPSDLLALAAAAIYLGLVVRSVAGLGSGAETKLLLAPLGIAGVLLLRRERLSPLKAWLLGACVVLFLAQYSAQRIPTNNALYVLAFPAVVVATLVCGRRPALALGVVILFTGAYQSLELLAHVPAPKLTDLLLVALWLSAGLRWVTTPGRTVPLRPALIVVGIYLLLSGFEILLADSTTAAVQSFRAQNWYLAVVLLGAYAPWPPQARGRMLDAAILAALAVGAYAVLRWQIGPSGAERAHAAAIPNNYLDKDLRPVGSFATAKELAAWTAIFAPFCLGMGLTRRGRWQLVALVAAGVCTVAMLAADVRAGPAAAVPGALVVVVLYQIAAAFRGRRGPAVLLIMLAAGVGAIGAFSLTLGSKPDTAERYSNILHPGRDPSYQARLIKWRTALDDIQDAPLGYGLGTAGRAQVRYGSYQNIGSIEIDNSYLKVAFEQGFVIMIILAAGLVMMLLTLVRGSMTVTERERAGPALAASGALVAMLLLFWIGDYIEGLPALGGWLLVGLALGQLTQPLPAAAEDA